MPPCVSQLNTHQITTALVSTQGTLTLCAPQHSSVAGERAGSSKTPLLEEHERASIAHEAERFALRSLLSSIAQRKDHLSACATQDENSTTVQRSVDLCFARWSLQFGGLRIALQVERLIEKTMASPSSSQFPWYVITTSLGTTAATDECRLSRQ